MSDRQPQSQSELASQNPSQPSRSPVPVGLRSLEAITNQNAQLRGNAAGNRQRRRGHGGDAVNANAGIAEASRASGRLSNMNSTGLADNPYGVSTMPRGARPGGLHGDVEHIDLREEGLAASGGPASLAGGLRMQNMMRQPVNPRAGGGQDSVTVFSRESRAVQEGEYPSNQPFVGAGEAIE